MVGGPLEKPAHLVEVDEPWLLQRKAGVLALGLGVVAFLVVAVVHGVGTSGMPPLALTLPGLGVVAVVSLVSLARREPGAYPLWLIGLALAAAAVVLGWFLMIAIVIGAAAVLIIILHAVM